MAQTIPLAQLALMLLPISVSALIYFKWCGDRYEIGTSTLRMVSQLLVIGYVLIFLFNNHDIWLGSLILLVMILMSSWIAIRPLPQKNQHIFSITLVSLSVSGTAILLLVLTGVLALDPLYQPSLVIPLAGMIYANAMNTISLAGERFFNEVGQGHAYNKARSTAYQAALIPQINSFLAVGFVSLPGMMTGQILSGVSPLIAVRYQIMVMAMIMGSSGLAAALFLILAKFIMQPNTENAESKSD